ARFWLHNGMLNFGGSKMSKSVGNIEKVHDLVRRHPPEALRHALLSAHYRQPLEWSDALVEQSVRTLDRLYGTLRDIDAVLASMPGAAPDADIPPAIEAALDDDLNTPQALAELSAIAGRARALRSTLAHGEPAGDDALRALAESRAALRAGGHVLGLLQQA